MYSVGEGDNVLLRPDPRYSRHRVRPGVASPDSIQAPISLLEVSGSRAGGWLRRRIISSVANPLRAHPTCQRDQAQHHPTGGLPTPGPGCS